MQKTMAQLITIGTEITTGEIVNSNAAWISRQLEDLGLRVRRHLVVQDNLTEIVQALKTYQEEPVVIVTGGLGPTSDDCTRAAMAHYAQVPLEFDNDVWSALQQLHHSRGLPVRKSHKHQCYFPHGSIQLPNPAGTAIAFYQNIQGRHYFVLPGPPREVEGTWRQSVIDKLLPLIKDPDWGWVRWTCIGSPESEVAELVEATLVKQAQDIEVGYRATVPYVKVKLLLNLKLTEHQRLKETIDHILAPFLIGEGDLDLARELLERWPDPDLNLQDTLSGSLLSLRLLTAREENIQSGKSTPTISLESVEKQKTHPTHYLRLEKMGEEFRIDAKWSSHHFIETRRLPFKIPLESERGRRSACEWALLAICRSLRMSDHDIF